MGHGVGKSITVSKNDQARLEELEKELRQLKEKLKFLENGTDALSTLFKEREQLKKDMKELTDAAWDFIKWFERDAGYIRYTKLAAAELDGESKELKAFLIKIAKAQGF